MDVPVSAVVAIGEAVIGEFVDGWSGGLPGTRGRQK